MISARGRAFVRELGAIAVGRSERKPPASDRRFADAAFRDHPLYRRLMQGYLAWRDALLGLVDEILGNGERAARTRFVLSLVLDGLAPTNLLPGNPAALKRAFETSGSSLRRGLRQLVDDLVGNGGLPSQVDRRPFRVGENLAVTPGQVVFRDDVLELIQYAPSTGEVYQRPIVFVPPQINKYYVLDLSPGRSLVEHALAQGFQVFVVSWRNPTPAQRDWGLDRYLASLKQATEVACEVTGSDRLNLLGACAGGITTAALLGHLAASGDERVAAATFLVTVLDSSVPSTISLLLTEKRVAAAIRRSQKRGILAGRELARVFAWLRPNDLVWSYWVNNYLLGAPPPAFDILYWNNDCTNLPAALHAEFLALFTENALVRPGALVALETPIDLGRVRADVFAVGALTDHITPWEACFRTPRLFGGSSTFVASSSGHIQAIVNPPGNAKSSYFVGDDAEPDTRRWLDGARKKEGTWWREWTAWLAARSGPRRSAPTRLGSPRHPPLEPAPGRYVHQRA